MRLFMSRFVRSAIDMIFVAIVVGGIAILALVLLFKRVVYLNRCPDGEHVGPTGFLGAVCEPDQTAPGRAR